MKKQEEPNKKGTNSNMTKDDKDRLDSYLDAGSAYTDKE